MSAIGNTASGRRRASTSRNGRQATRNRLKKRRLILERLEDRLVLAQILWDGGGDGVSWLDANNWTGDALPGSTDTAVIEDSDLLVRIGGAVTVGGLDATSSLIVDAGGSLTLKGSSIVRGDFTVTNGRTLRADGPDVVVEITGNTVADGCDLFSARVHAAIFGGCSGVGA
jgi:hypothetical protein